MDYKIDPDLLRKYIAGIDLTKLRTDVGNYGFGSEFDDAASPRISPHNERDLAKRAKIGASFDGLNVLTKSRAQDIEQIMALLIMRGSVNHDNL